MRLPLAKGAAEHGEAEGFAPTETRRGFKKYCFQMILPYPLRANPHLYAHACVCVCAHIFFHYYIIKNARARSAFSTLSFRLSRGGLPPAAAHREIYQ